MPHGKHYQHCPSCYFIISEKNTEIGSQWPELL